MKKLSILFFCVMLLCSSFVMVRADEPDEEEDETIELTDTYYVVTAQREQSLKVPFNKNWFKEDATTYHHDLAKLSLGLAVAAFRPNAQATPDKAADANLLDFLSQAGFDDLRSDDYDKNPSMYTVSTVMGHQTVGEGDEAFELIAVGICGQGYMNEWESNFTIGGGLYPEGFSRSAQLVYDRVFGYLNMYGISGPVKIWMSGFSRAAAITNITSAWLSDTEGLGKENVFAYTFGTPRTTIRQNAKEYTNIFNICGKMDPVTNVPFADWGYERFGVDLFTPAQETDSNFSSRRIAANEVYREITGIDFWTNSDMNFQLRNIMSYFLKICPTVDVYTASLQDKLIALWENHDIVSVINNLMDMANDPLLINEDNRHEANMLLNYISYMLLDYMSSGNAFSRWNNNASMVSNIAQSHTPELYISWIFSAGRGAEVFTEADTFTRVIIEGDVIVTLYKNDKPIEKEETGGEAGEGKYFQYLGYADGKITALIPRDRDYAVDILSKSDQTVSLFEADYVIGHQSPDQTVIRHFDVEEEERFNAYYEAGKDPYYAKEETSSEIVSFESDQYDTTNRIIEFERSNMLALSWRTLIIIAMILPIVVITFLLFIFAAIISYLRFRYLKRKNYIPKKLKFRPLPIFATFLIFRNFLIEELQHFLYPDITEFTRFFKIIIGLLTLLIAFYGYRRKKDRFHAFLILAVLFLMAADVLITDNLILGAIMHILAYVFLSYNFITEERPGTGQYIAFGILSAIGIYVILSTGGTYGFLRVLAIVYILASSALIVSSFPLSRRYFRGCLLLYLSGILLIANQVVGQTFLSHFGALFLYYVAVVTLASSGSGIGRPKMVPVTMLQREESDL